MSTGTESVKVSLIPSGALGSCIGQLELDSQVTVLIAHDLGTTGNKATLHEHDGGR